jgi:RimJ/RimL family protein N-acetyltransferase
MSQDQQQKSPEELELEFRDVTNIPNWPGYDGRLEIRELKHSDSPLLAPILRSDRSNLSTFLGKFYGHKNWNIKSATGFVSGLLKQSWPAMHWLAHINELPVGLVSTASVDNLKECQIVICVFAEHQGRGIATAMAKTVLKITEEVMGFEATWWYVDAANIASIKVAQKLGFQRLDSYDSQNSTRQASGIYHRFVRERPNGLAPGILQGAAMEYWWAAKDPELLKLVVEARTGVKNEEAQQVEDSESLIREKPPLE